MHFLDCLYTFYMVFGNIFLDQISRHGGADRKCPTPYMEGSHVERQQETIYKGNIYTYPFAE